MYGICLILQENMRHNHCVLPVCAPFVLPVCVLLGADPLDLWVRQPVVHPFVCRSP